MSEQAHAMIQGVDTPVTVIEGVTLPLALLADIKGTVHIHNVRYDGEKTYDFSVLDTTSGKDTRIVKAFDPHAAR